MNNEPVALVNNMCNDSIDWKVDPLKLEEGTPLYTHPVKTLTDEEILVFQDANGNELKVDTTKWKLRKAQEK
jgi:hypothetical protein